VGRISVWHHICDTYMMQDSESATPLPHVAAKFECDVADSGKHAAEATVCRESVQKIYA
jgi:hypothetical protein